jgi:AcrR family transcriptional regulator
VYRVPLPGMSTPEPTTRQRLIEATVECILDEGYYRASSNRIAERASVTWGVIQHHFHTREGLLVAVVGASAGRLIDLLEGAEITGATVEERLDSLAEVAWAHYGQPEFLVSMQITMNLSRDPRTAADTIDALAVLDRRVLGLWQRLVDQVVPAVRQPAGFGRALFQILRGVAVGDVLADEMIAGGPRRRGRQGERDLLLRSLGLLIVELTDHAPDHAPEPRRVRP